MERPTSAAKPEATINSIGPWFEERLNAFDTDKDGAISGPELGNALSHPQNARDEAHLNFLYEHRQLLQNGSKDRNRYDEAITTEDMKFFDGWVSDMNTQREKYRVANPGEGRALDFALGNFKLLDRDGSGDISRAEATKALKTPNLTADQKAGLQELIDNFRTFSASPFLGKELPVGPKQLATRMVISNVQDAVKDKTYDGAVRGANRIMNYTTLMQMQINSKTNTDWLFGKP